jgi:hypothetical protein
MNSNKVFNSQIREVGSFATHVSNEQIKLEPMFFNCDLDYAYSNGGLITKAFIDTLPAYWFLEDCVFDSRVHMLMPGWYPAIPGFHHDDVPRPDIPVGQHFITAGQPDYDNPRYYSEHILGLVNADVCPTEFALGTAEFSRIPDGELIYRKWHEEVLNHLEAGRMERYTAKDRTLIEMDWQTFHQGTAAVSNGWRWFGRVSRHTNRVKKVTNEMRQQVQVYLEFPMEGW